MKRTNTKIQFDKSNFIAYKTGGINNGIQYLVDDGCNIKINDTNL